MSEGNGTPGAGRDDGADRDKRAPKPCCKRVTDPVTGQYGYCTKPDGHERTPLDNGCIAEKLTTPPTRNTFTPVPRPAHVKK